jgi:hypothetical protein
VRLNDRILRGHHRRRHRRGRHAPSAGVTLAQNNVEFSEVIQLPVRGHPRSAIRSTPTRLVIGVVLQRLRGQQGPDPVRGRSERAPVPLPAGAAPRQVMIGPTLLDPQSLRAPDDPYDTPDAFEPFRAALATSARSPCSRAPDRFGGGLFRLLRPLHDLVLNSGALVLGVWGIHGILPRRTSTT